MRLVKLVLAMILLLGAIFGIGGLFLPSAFRITSTTTVGAAPDRIWPLVSSHAGWNRFTQWTRDEDPSITVTAAKGPAEGVGMVYEVRSKYSGNGTFELVEADANKRVAYALRFEGEPMEIRGEITLQPANLQDAVRTKVIWSETGDVGRNLLYRWSGLFMQGTVEDHQARHLASIKALAEAPPAP